MLNTAPRRSESGFSLIELVIAVVLIATVLGTVATASIISSDNNIRSQSQVKLAAALEQAVERIHIQQPWFGNVAGCTNIATAASCSYNFDVSSTERFTFRADVVVTRMSDDANTFDVSTTVTAIDRATGVAVTQMRPVRTSFVKDLRKKEQGDIAIFSCRVNQADDRMAGGSCAVPPEGVAPTTPWTGWTPMEPPHGAPKVNDPNKCNTGTAARWLLPPYQSYTKACNVLMWEYVTNDNLDRIYYYPNNFNATVVNDVTGAVQTIANAPGRYKFTGLERGRYTVTVTETSGTAGHLFWENKSAGNLDGASKNVYKLVVTPGTQTRITRIWEPQPVTVTFPIIVGDAAIPWEPRNNDELPVNPDGFHHRAMLVPYPQGRVTVPGVSSAEYAACPNPANNRNTLVGICDRYWGDIAYNAKWVTMTGIRPGLYEQDWYHSYYRDADGDNNGWHWHFKQRGFGKKDLGFGWPTYKWNSTFSQTGRIGYIYVHPNGTVTTPMSSLGAGAVPTMRYPGCTNRRALLTEIFKHVPNYSDGTERWIYQSAVDGVVYPSEVWDSMANTPGLQAWAQANPGDEAVGWVRRLRREDDDKGETYSVYLAANGFWANAEEKTEYRKRETVNGSWGAWPEPENGRILYYRWQKLDGTWVYVQDDRATAAERASVGRTVQWKVMWSDWKPWSTTPYTINESDISETRTLPSEDAQGYRKPLPANILYNNNPGVGVTEFKAYDQCTSSDKEVDSDGTGLV